MKDTYRHKGLRRRLLRTLRKKGIKDEHVLSAISNVPRHFFIDMAFDEWAYKDRAFSIGNGQTISQPYTVATQTKLLDLQPGDRVLEVGTGSGYQAAILAELGYQVYTIERIEAFYNGARKLLQKMGYSKINFFLGDGYKGLMDQAPFQGIVVTAGAKSLPQDLLTQLSLGGNMVIPIGNDEVQTMYRIKRVKKDNFKKSAHGEFSFVPLLPGTIKDE